MTKPLLSLITILTLGSCYVGPSIYTYEPLRSSIYYADGHAVLQDSTERVKFIIYMQPQSIGRNLDLKVKLLNISDHLIEVHPSMFSIRYYDSENSVVKERRALDPVEQELKNYKAIGYEKYQMERGYPFQSMTVGGSMGMLGYFAGDVDLSDEAYLVSDAVLSYRYSLGDKKISRLSAELQEIEAVWLQRNTLFPNEYVQGTVQIPLYAKDVNFEIIFRDGKEDRLIPVEVRRVRN